MSLPMSVTPERAVSEIFEKRRAAASRQSAYRRRRRLGLIMVAFEVIEADLTAAGLRRGIAAPEHKRAGCPEHTLLPPTPAAGISFC